MDDEQNQLLNTINYRIEESPSRESIILDEIVHHKLAIPDWTQCLAKRNNTDNLMFFPGAIFDQFKN